MKNLNPSRLGMMLVGVILAIILALNCYTIVSTGSEASVESFGEVHKGKILTGFNLVMPWWGIDEYSTLYDTETKSDLEVASKDKFKTNMDVSFTGAFLYGFADKTRGGTGDSDKFKEVHVYKRVLSCLTKAGGKVENSQAFFKTETQIQLGKSTLDCVNDYLQTIDGQYQLSSVQFSDIRLDPVVKGFMKETKKRQEEENQAESELKIADTLAQKIVKTSAAKLLAADNNKQAREKAADAKLYEATQEAEGKLITMTQEAEGNTLLNKTITPKLNDYIKSNRWNGQLPTVQAGTESSFLIDTRK